MVFCFDPFACPKRFAIVVVSVVAYCSNGKFDQPTDNSHGVDGTDTSSEYIFRTCSVLFKFRIEPRKNRLWGDGMD